MFDADVAIVVPYRHANDDQRERIWRWVEARYRDRHPDWMIVRGYHDDGEWSKGLAVADALRTVTAHTLVIADSDVWTDALTPAVACVEAGAAWVSPRGKVRRLAEEPTERVLAGAGFDESMRLDRAAYDGVTAGGIVVLTRSLYERVPIDPRFVGWGMEDVAWTAALTAVAGPPVILAVWPLWHLWHEPLDGRKPSNANRLLERRYRYAGRNVQKMESVLEAAREAIGWQTQPT